MKSFFISLALVVSLPTFAQKEVNMGENFSLSGKSVFFLKTENADGVKPSSGIWNLQGVKNDSIAAVSFYLKDPKTEEVSDSVEWKGNVHVIMKISDKGGKTYLVQDEDSIYMRVINLQDDLFVIKMYSSPIYESAEMTSPSKGGWKITHQTADELKGNEAYSSYVYSQPGMGAFVFWGFEKFQFRIVSDDGIFNYKSTYSRYSGAYQGESILVGLYDNNDNLIEKFNMWLDREMSKDGKFLTTRNAGTMSNPVGQKGKVKKIFKHLQGQNGYVRIVATRYNHADFDLKIPPVNN